ncbi:hypothetical protein [Clostridium sp.]|uniref:hypothetical protein n=1 Tax=Clostridium sp. TaxID=1506 RepID=UPI0029017AF2|nr:hypothetical protein [Clostridium sp.]MDU2284142.1 hypothetical protein [Clostridium sp.]
MKVRSLVDKFTLKEKRKYIAKGRIYDVLHEEEKRYVVNDVDGDDVILRHSECEVVEYDNSENMDIKIGEQFVFNGVHVEVKGIDGESVEFYRISDNELKRSTYIEELKYFKERAIPMGRLMLKNKLDKLGKAARNFEWRNWVNTDVCKEAMEFEEQLDELVKEKPKMKCEILKESFSHRLRESIQCFLEENKIEEVISLSCYFDSSAEDHVAVIVYR